MNTTRQGDITGFDDAEVVDEEQEEDSSQTETYWGGGKFADLLIHQKSKTAPVMS